MSRRHRGHSGNRGGHRQPTGLFTGGGFWFILILVLGLVVIFSPVACEAIR